jgi:hypothetical protein
VSGSGGTWGSGGVRAAATWCGGGRQQPGAALGQSVQTWGQQQQRSSIEIFVASAVGNGRVCGTGFLLIYNGV